MNLTPFVIAWICLGVATFALAAYRKFHRWGEGLTILMAVAGVVLGGFYL